MSTTCSNNLRLYADSCLYRFLGLFIKFDNLIAEKVNTCNLKQMPFTFSISLAELFIYTLTVQIKHFPAVYPSMRIAHT